MLLSKIQIEVLKKIQNTHFEYLYFFNQIHNLSRVKEIGQKSYNVAQLFNTAITNPSSFRNGAFGFATNGKAHQIFKQKNNLYKDLAVGFKYYYEGLVSRTEVFKYFENSVEKSIFPEELERELDLAFDLMIEYNPTIGSETSIFARSCKLVREDTLDVAGAGKHDSYGNLKLRKDWKLGIFRVFMSDYSLQALPDYQNLFTDERKYLHLYSDMSCIVMEQIESTKGCSILAFSDFNGGIKILTAPNMMGEVLVGGQSKVTPNEVVLSRRLLLSGKNPFLTDLIISDQFKNVGFGLPKELIIEIGKWVIELDDAINDPVDTEGCYDGNSLTFVQYRHNVPNIKLRDQKEITFYTVKGYPAQKVLCKGTTINEMCGQGVAYTLTSLEELDNPNFGGKVLLYADANPELTVLTSLPKEKIPAGLVVSDGSELCHLAVNLSDSFPAIVGSVFSCSIANGMEVTILHGLVYEGNHPYETSQVDLAKLPSLSDGTIAKLVDARPSDVQKNSKLPHRGFALVRQEALQIACDIPSILACLYPERIYDTHMSYRVNKFREGYSSAKEAYITAIVRNLVPFCESALSKNGTVGFRTYGGRIDEDNPFINGMPKQLNPMSGFNGAFAYIDGYFKDTEESWGEQIFRVSCEIFLRIQELGYSNVEFFIPNLACPEELKFLGKIMQEYGLHLNRELRAKTKPFVLKIMAEMPSTFIYTEEFVAMGVDAFSAGFNDLRQSCEFYDRGLNSKFRGKLNSKAYIALHDIMFKALAGTHVKYETCGVPDLDFIPYLVKNGAYSIGLAPGKKFVDGYKAIYNAKVELGLI